MQILVRKRDGGKWARVKEQKFQSEAMLQDILYQSPDIIPIEKLGEHLIRPRLFVKEAGLPGSGYTDLIGIDENGGITVVECKLATNTDIRRKVIGQVFEYAAYLWQMSYEDFDAVCSKAERWGESSLVAAMRKEMEKTGEEWSEEQFKANVATALKEGDFRLIIAVDALNDELRRIIQFLNSRGDNHTQIYALELQQFESEELQLLVPEMLGPAISPKPAGMMDEETFLAQSSHMCRQLYLRLKDLTRINEFSRSSFSRRGFVFRYRTVNLFVLFPNYLSMWIGRDYSDEYLTQDILREFWQEMLEVRTLKARQDKKNPEVHVNDSTWDQDDVNRFVNALKLLVPRPEAKSETA